MSDHPWINRGISFLSFILAASLSRDASSADDNAPKRMVLVELYTSQGCDMCPEAEAILGKLAVQKLKDRPDCLPRRLLQQPLEGCLLRLSLQSAANGL